jgi:hypothetical protein
MSALPLKCISDLAETAVNSAWDPVQRKKIRSIKESFLAWSGALATAADIVFYGTWIAGSRQWTPVRENCYGSSAGARGLSDDQLQRS